MRIRAFSAHLAPSCSVLTALLGKLIYSVRTKLNTLITKYSISRVFISIINHHHAKLNLNIKPKLN